nr:AsmA family protein [Pantoea sp. 201603H]
MKFIGKFILTLLLLLIFIVVVLYFLLQTQWGAGWAGRFISDRTDYHLSLTKIEHNFSSPSHLILDNVTFGHDGQPAVLVADRVDLGLALTQFSNPFHFASIEFMRGSLDVANNNLAWPLQANRLQLTDMAVNSPHFSLPISAQRVNGGVMPWQPKENNFLGENANFQLSAGSMELNGIPGNNVLLQGRIAQDQLVFSNVGADLARGSMTGNAERDAEGNWNIANLRLNDIRLQTDSSLTTFLQPIFDLPSVHIGRLDLINAHLQGPEWAVTDLDLTLKDLTLREGDWQSEMGTLSMNASNFINGRLELNDPIVNMDFSPQGINISQFSSRWVNGLLRAKGQWIRNNKRLMLDELVVAGLEYTLPDNWRDRWMQPLPDWLDSVAVKKFSANRNLIIDINPAYPFQLTALDGKGSDLLLARNHQWGIWRGELSFNAAEATFNRTDIRRPSIALNADANQISVTEMSAFAANGMLEGLATVTQQPTRDLSLTLNGREVPTNILHNWGWPTVPQAENSALQLQLNARLENNKPLRDSASGKLTISVNGQTTEQNMVNGSVY